MAQELRFTAAERDAGRRLDQVVAERAGLSRSAAARRIDEVAVTVDGHPVKRSAVLELGATVVVPAPASPPAVPPPPMPPVRYDDEHLLVVSKPPGLVVHPGAGHRGDTLVDAMRAAGERLAPGTADERPGIVHRLDRDTSGLLVVARDVPTRDGLIDQLRARTVLRRYEALVRGEPPATSGIVDAPIGRHPSDRQRFACVEGGRPARTHWEVVGTGVVEPVAGRAHGRDSQRLSVVRCRLETGRTHQIRVHLQAIGNPVVGDDRYGAQPQADDDLDVPRLALHAATLGFVHPVTGERIELSEPVPADLRRLWTAVLG